MGLNLSWSLFAGGRDYFNTANTHELWAASLASRESAGRGALSSLKQSYVAYVEAAEKLKVDRMYLDASTVQERIGRSKYNNGLLNFEDWDLIESNLITRQKTVLQSRQSRVVAEASWEQTEGKSVIP